jgi:hypothetical protein
LKARIEWTVAWLENADANAFEGAEQRDCSFEACWRRA